MVQLFTLEWRRVSGIGADINTIASWLPEEVARIGSLKDMTFSGFTDDGDMTTSSCSSYIV